MSYKKNKRYTNNHGIGHVLAYAVVIAGILIGIVTNHQEPKTLATSSLAQVLTSAQPVQPAEPRDYTPLTNLGYNVLYNEQLKNPACVTYQLTQADKLTKPPSRPKIPFETDKRTQAKTDTRDFTHSGFDRGHLAASSTIGAFHGAEAQAQTFLLSNISPQNPETNSGVWNSIERMEADDFTKRFGIVNTYVGPVFPPDPKKLPSGIAIPIGFFKVIQRPDNEIICFYVPQDTSASQRPEDYLTSLNQINSATGLEILPNLHIDKKTQTRTKIW